MFSYINNKNQYFFIHLFPKSNMIGNFYDNFILIQIQHTKIHKKSLHSQRKKFIKIHSLFFSYIHNFIISNFLINKLNL